MVIWSQTSASLLLSDTTLQCDLCRCYFEAYTPTALHTSRTNPRAMAAPAPKCAGMSRKPRMSAFGPERSLADNEPEWASPDGSPQATLVLSLARSRHCLGGLAVKSVRFRDTLLASSV